MYSRVKDSILRNETVLVNLERRLVKLYTIMVARIQTLALGFTLYFNWDAIYKIDFVLEI